MCHMNPSNRHTVNCLQAFFFFFLPIIYTGPMTIYISSSGTAMKSIAANPPLQYVHTSDLDLSSLSCTFICLVWIGVGHTVCLMEKSLSGRSKKKYHNTCTCMKYAQIWEFAIISPFLLENRSLSCISQCRHWRSQASPQIPSSSVHTTREDQCPTALLILLSLFAWKKSLK